MCVYLCGSMHVSARALRGQSHQVPAESLPTPPTPIVVVVCVLPHLNFEKGFTQHLRMALNSWQPSPTLRLQARATLLAPPSSW